MTSRTQDFKKFSKFFWIIPCYWLLLKSFHIILKLTAPICLKRFYGSQIIFSEKCSRFQMASNFSSRTSLLIFWFLLDFVNVFIVIRFVVMSYWSPMHDKHPHSLMENYLSVFIDFRWNLMNLMAVKNLKITFRKFYWTLTNLKIFVNCYSNSVLTEPSCFLLKLK